MEKYFRIRYLFKRCGYVRGVDATRRVIELFDWRKCTTLKDFLSFRLTTQCEKCGQELYPGLQETSSSSCKCKKQQAKGSNPVNDLSIKGHGFYGSTNRNEILPFESIFTKE